jgi:UDP-N-acetylglucosamine 3-dehydrogenase
MSRQKEVKAMLKVGLIGPGFIGNIHLQSYEQIKNLRVVAIAEGNEVSGRKAAELFHCDYYPSAEDMLNRADIDMVDICVPTFLHEKFVLMAAAAGKHVLCEKPLALHVDTVDRMISAARRAGVKFMAAQTLRFWPEYVKIKQLMDEGVFGRLEAVATSRLAQPSNWSQWFKDPAKSGGTLYDLLLHDIDYLRYALGPINSVYAVGTQSEIGAWEHIIASLTFQNGVKASVEAAHRMAEGFPFTMTFRAVGTKATVDFHFTAGHNLENKDQANSRFDYYENGKGLIPVHVPQGDAYVEELRYFADCILSDREPLMVPLEQSREVLAVMAVIQRSLENGVVQNVT